MRNSERNRHSGYPKESPKSQYQGEREFLTSSWISRTLCTAPSVISLDTVEEDCYSSSSFDDESPHKLNPSKERIIHICGSGERDPIQLEVGFDSGASIEVCRIADPDQCLQEAKMISQQRNRSDSQRFQKKDSFNFFLCNGLDNWYYHDEEREEKEEIRTEMNVPRNKNRCSHPQNRRDRIELLRNNLSPFQKDEISRTKQFISSKYSPVELNKRAFSFSDADVKSPCSVSQRQNSCGDQKKSQLLKISCNNACAFATVASSSSLTLSYLGDDDEYNESLCYDSDPGEVFTQFKSEIRLSTSSEKHRGHFCFDDEIMLNQPIWSNIILVWHRNTNQDFLNTNPKAVRAWIENGSCIRNGIIQPKLMWQETFGRDKKENRTILSSRDLHSVDLLDISKVIPFKNCNRLLYPFAKKETTFIIGYDDFKLVFEAENQETRDFLIDSLKFTIARLGSMIITEDRNVMDEFFSPVGYSVPGTIPQILQV